MGAQWYVKILFFQRWHFSSSRELFNASQNSKILFKIKTLRNYISWHSFVHFDLRLLGKPQKLWNITYSAHTRREIMTVKADAIEIFKIDNIEQRKYGLRLFILVNKIAGQFQDFVRLFKSISMYFYTIYKVTKSSFESKSVNLKSFI